MEEEASLQSYGQVLSTPSPGKGSAARAKAQVLMIIFALFFVFCNYFHLLRKRTRGTLDHQEHHEDNASTHSHLHGKEVGYGKF